ncbi:hypothetical protein [Gudongella sp. DL1XJH-153]|uniref:hypothetical protein n=1 Tax=Gudongella sp. DL1XJH-153 TaxID=3409804 RepID=UPI003BB6FE32
MSKLFAVFLPIISIVITTLVIVFYKNNSSETTSKKTKFLWIGFGILMFLAGVVVFVSILKGR